ncbi:DUF7507 domain-containing protein, partial [Pararhodonellum marinum]|uniref:DUF7507 domain-containing protein n=1 Tax=Pararhodonellum marinum TaxID=2755358 RepID=UPI00188F6188
TGSLADIPVGGSRELTTTYQATQADIDAGTTLVNSVSVTTDEVPGPTEDTAETTISQTAGLTVSKTVNPTSISEPTLLQYTITIENTGNVALTGLNVTDILPDGSTATLSGSLADIPVGGSRELTTTYQATQADIDAGTTLVNSVSVTTDEVPGPTEDTAETTISQEASLTIEKIVDRTSITEPTSLNYTITIVNTGNVALTGLQVTDILPNGEIANLNGSFDDIPVGEVRVLSTNYSVSQEEIDEGDDLINRVSIITNEVTIPTEDTAITTVSSQADILVEKTVNRLEIGSPTTLNYSISIRNTGGITLTGLVVRDILPDGTTIFLSQGNQSIAPGQNLVFPVSYSATQADIDAGLTLVNTVEVETNEIPGPTTDTAETDIVQSAGLTITKVVEQTSISTPTTLNYTITISNTGNVLLTCVQLTDRLPDGTVVNIPVTPNILTLGQSRSFNITYEATQADIEAGISLINEARVVSDQVPGPSTATAETSIDQNSGLTVNKIVDQNNIQNPGVLNYTITITNTGNVPLTGLQVTDILPNGSNASIQGSLANIPVGGSRQLTATYQVTQADIDIGEELINTVEVVTNEVAGPTSDTAVTVITQNPSATITKVVNRTNITEPTPLSYTITIVNTGNITLTNIQVIDILPNGEQANLNGSLADIPVGGSRVLSTTYNATQADIDAGVDLVNRVSFIAAEITDAIEDTAITQVSSEPALSIEKTVNRENISQPTQLNYRISLTNTGSITLTGVVVEEIFPDGRRVILTQSNQSLAPGQNLVFTTSYSVTQADINAGNTLVNTVSVTSIEVPGPIVDTAETTISSQPGLTVEKVVDQTSILEPETLNYTITIANTGNVALSGLVVTDILPNGEQAELSGSLEDIPVGGSRALTTSYTVSQSEINSGEDLVNTVSVITNEVPGPITDSAVTTIEQAGSLTVSKVVDVPNIDQPTLLNYTITIQNTGNQALTGLQVTDILPDGNTADLQGSLADIPVGQSRIFTTSYEATQADINLGETLVNTVSVVTNEVPGPTVDTAETTIDQDPILSIVKEVDQASISEPTILNYTITVANTGNVVLTGVQVSDLLPDGSPAQLEGSMDDIPIGESRVFTTTYTATQGDLDSGEPLVNTASVVTNEVTTPVNDTAETTIIQNPSFTLSKSVDQEMISGPVVLNYTITIVNTGNVALRNLTVLDVLPNGNEINLSTEIGEIGVGETGIINTTYQVTQAEINAGAILVNSVSVSNDLLPDPLSDIAETIIQQVPGLTVEKTVDIESISAPTRLNYTIRIRNTGNVTLTGIQLIDILPNGNQGTPTGSLANLAVGGERIFTISYQASQGDVNRGNDLINTVRVVTNEVPGPTEDTAVTTIIQNPQLTVTKTVNRTDINSIQVLNYTITLVNTGNVTLTGLQVEDVLPNGILANLAGSLADIPIAGTRVLTTNYQVTQADFDLGEILVNTVTVTTNEIPEGISDTSETILNRNPSLTVVKTVDRTGIAQPGILNYLIRITNTGNVTLTGLLVTDLLPNGTVGQLTGSLNDIQVGEIRELRAVYEVTAEDIDAGSNLVNLVTVVTNEVPGPSTDDAVTVINQAAAMTVEKTVDKEVINGPELLSYTIVINNTGNVTLTGLRPIDVLPNGNQATLTGSLDDIPVGESRTLTTTYQVSQAEIDARDTLINRVEVAVNELPIVIEDEAQTIVVLNSDLSIEKVADLEQARQGDTIKYTITIRNNGPSIARNIYVRDELPEDLTFVSTNQGGEVAEDGALEWRTPTLAVGDVFELELVTIVNNLANTGDFIRNIATVDSTTDPEGTKESDPGLGIEVIIDPSTTLTVSKSVDVEEAFLGDVVVYSIIIRNDSEIPAFNLEVRDTLPNQFMVVELIPDATEVIGNSILWEVDVLEANEERIFTINTIVTGTGNDIVNRVSVIGNNFPDALANSPAIQVFTEPDRLIDLSITKSVSNNVVIVGNQFTYEITVVNNSEELATNVLVRDVIPPAVLYISSVFSEGTIDFNPQSQLLSWTLNELPPNTPKVLQIIVRAITQGTVLNQANVTASQPDEDVSDNIDEVEHRQIDFDIPSVFTPNGDGVNDTWDISGLTDEFPENSVVIVNRWGSEVFKSNNYRNDWGGENLIEGTYFYRITVTEDLTGRQLFFTGYVTILK